MYSPLSSPHCVLEHHDLVLLPGMALAIPFHKTGKILVQCLLQFSCVSLMFLVSCCLSFAEPQLQYSFFTSYLAM